MGFLHTDNYNKPSLVFDLIEPFRQAATYVDRILRGKKPADLPVQVPTRYSTTLNLRTAKALGILL